MALLTGFLAVILVQSYWAVLRANDIAVREDNPRQVEAELRILRGTVYDRHGQILAETVGSGSDLQRLYPLSSAGPAVGYYSFRHGTAGIEESFDDLLRGEGLSLWEETIRETLHRPQTGHGIRLTLDSRLQAEATAVFPNLHGGVLLLSLPQNEILALASFPSYDPNQLDAEFEALTAEEDGPLLNRVTQGQYQPGLTLQPFLLAALLDQGALALDERVNNPTRSIVINGTTLRCQQQPTLPAIWAQLVAAQCPAPIQAVAGRLTAAELTAIWNRFGLTMTPPLPLPSETAALEPVNDLALALIGQDNLLITPLQLALAWAALGDGGQLRPPRLVLAQQDNNGNWIDLPVTTQATTAVSADAAQQIRSALPVAAEIAGVQTAVLSGPDGSMNSWYLGLAPADAPRFAVVVVLEETAATEIAAQVGHSLLNATLQRLN